MVFEGIWVRLFFFLMWFWNDWWSVSLFGEQSQMRFSFICLKCPSYKYSLLYFALNNSKPLLLSEAPSGNFVFLFNSKILKKRDIQGWVWAKNKKQDSGNFLSQQQIVLLSWSSPKAEQSWLDGHWGGEIKLQGRSEKQPAGRCGRAHSELLKWPESIVKRRGFTPLTAGRLPTSAWPPALHKRDEPGS